MPEARAAYTSKWCRILGQIPDPFMSTEVLPLAFLKTVQKVHWSYFITKIEILGVNFRHIEKWASNEEIQENSFKWTLISCGFSHHQLETKATSLV